MKEACPTRTEWIAKQPPAQIHDHSLAAPFGRTVHQCTQCRPRAIVVGPQRLAASGPDTAAFVAPPRLRRTHYPPAVHTTANQISTRAARLAQDLLCGAVPWPTAPCAACLPHQRPLVTRAVSSPSPRGTPNDHLLQAAPYPMAVRRCPCRCQCALRWVGAREVRVGEYAGRRDEAAGDAHGCHRVAEHRDGHRRSCDCANGGGASAGHCRLRGRLLAMQWALEEVTLCARHGGYGYAYYCAA